MFPSPFLHSFSCTPLFLSGLLSTHSFLFLYRHSILAFVKPPLLPVAHLFAPTATTRYALIDRMILLIPFPLLPFTSLFFAITKLCSKHPMPSPQLKRRVNGDASIETLNRNAVVSYLEALLTDLMRIYKLLKKGSGRTLHRQSTELLKLLVDKIHRRFTSLMHDGNVNARTAARSIFQPGDAVRHVKGMRVRFGTVVACHQREEGDEGRWAWKYDVVWVGKSTVAECDVGSTYLTSDRLFTGNQSNPIQIQILLLHHHA